MKKNKLYFLVLFLIVLWGGWLRVYGLDKSPPSLNWDEASLGYNAYSILKTGKDEYNQTLPIFTRSFDDYKSAVPAYLSIPLIVLFGLNEISIRLTSAIAGIVSIIAIFGIGYSLFKSFKIALLSAFFFAIAPFSIFFSRALFEANIALAFFLFGYWCYLSYRKKTLLFVASMILFILSMYTYHSYKIFVPIFIFGLFLSDKKTWLANRKNLLLALSVSAVLLIPMVIFTLGGQTLARFSSTSILKLMYPPFNQAITQNHDLGQFLNLFVHNQLFYFLWEIFGRYTAYFSPANIFIQEAAEPGQRIPTLAVLYPFEAVFWLIGLLAVFKRFRENYPLGLLILLSPIPAVVTWNWFHQVRVLPLFAAYSIVSGFGAHLVIRWVVDFLGRHFGPAKTKFQIVLVISIVFFGLWNSLYLFDALFVLLPKYYSGDWQPGFKQSIPVIARLQNNYDQIIIESPHAQPYIFTLFYQAYPPGQYQMEADYVELAKGPRKKYDFGKYVFKKIYWPDDRKLKKTLFMGTVFSLPEQDIKTQPNAKVISNILDRDGNISIRIVGLE